MAASIFHGFRGKIEWATVAISDKITAWSINATVDVHDVTGMEATNVSRQKLLGLTDWTATVEGPGDSTGPHIVEGAAGQLEMWISQTAADGILYGAAILSSYTFTQDGSDAGRVVYNFQGNGVLNYVVAAP